MMSVFLGAASPFFGKALVESGLSAFERSSVVSCHSFNPQAAYAAGGRGGTGSLILATLLLGVVTPFGEELLFRGVVTNGLLRFGGWLGVIGSAVIFALAHGMNIVLPVAFLLGLVTGELFRQSSSVWPGVAAHIVYNLPTVPLMLWSQVS